MTPKIVHHPGSTAVGIDVRTRNADEVDPAKARIGALWQRFFREGIAARIASDARPPAIVGVYSDYESDHTGAYSLLVGGLTDETDRAPAGMKRIAIPAGRYMVFEARGAMPQALIETWGRIWKHFDESPAARRAYTVDFELYRADGSADVHIAIV